MIETIRPWASSTTRRRCGGWNSISSRSISAPRCDMFLRTFSLTSCGHATEGERQILLVDLAEDELHVPVLELDDVLEGEEQQADLLGQVGVRLGEAVEDVALGRPVGVVEDLGQRLDAARRRVLLRDDARELLLDDALDDLQDVRADLGHRRDARGDVGLDLRARAR